MQETEAVPVIYKEGKADSVPLSFWKVSYKRKKKLYWYLEKDTE